MTVSEWELILRIAAAGVLGGLLGYEREVRKMPVGVRTYGLVAMGSAAFISASILISQETSTGRGTTAEASLNADQVRVAAGLVAGVGFLGAGAILRKGKRVRGLTTAASIWVTAAIGLLIGAGFWIAGVGLTVLALLMIFALRSD